MTDNPKWTLTTAADLSACAEELFTTHRIASEEVRGWDVQGNDIHKLQIHSSDPDSGVMATAEVGCRITLKDGTTPLVMTADESAAWGITP